MVLNCLANNQDRDQIAMVVIVVEVEMIAVEDLQVETRETLKTPHIKVLAW